MCLAIKQPGGGWVRKPFVTSLLTHGDAKGVAGSVLREFPLKQGSLQTLAEGFGGKQTEYPIVPRPVEIRVHDLQQSRAVFAGNSRSAVVRPVIKN